MRHARISLKVATTLPTAAHQTTETNRTITDLISTDDSSAFNKDLLSFRARPHAEQSTFTQQRISKSQSHNHTNSTHLMNSNPANENRHLKVSEGISKLLNPLFPHGHTPDSRKSLEPSNPQVSQTQIRLILLEAKQQGGLECRQNRGNTKESIRIRCSEDLGGLNLLGSSTTKQQQHKRNSNEVIPNADSQLNSARTSSKITSQSLQFLTPVSISARQLSNNYTNNILTTNKSKQHHLLKQNSIMLTSSEQTLPVFSQNELFKKTSKKRPDQILSGAPSLLASVSLNQGIPLFAQIQSQSIKTNESIVMQEQSLVFPAAGNASAVKSSSQSYQEMNNHQIQVSKTLSNRHINNNSSNLYQQYMERFIGRNAKGNVQGVKGDSIIDNARSSSTQHQQSTKSPARRGVQTIKKSYSSERTATTKVSAPTTILRFPAVQSELAEFNREIEQNEFRFARENSNSHSISNVNNNKNINGISNANSNKLEHQTRQLSTQNIPFSNQINQSQSSLLFLDEVVSMNRSTEQEQLKRKRQKITSTSDCFLITELIKERNQAEQLQRGSIIKVKQLAQEEQAKQLESLVDESMKACISSSLIISKNNRKSQSSQSPSKDSVSSGENSNIKSLKIKQTKVPQNNNPSTVLSSTNLKSLLNKNTKQPIKSFNFSSEEVTTQKNKELTREIEFEDELLHSKLGIRQRLQSYIESKPRVLKSIQRRCFMEFEEVIYFLMSFYQFCIDELQSTFQAEFSARMKQQHFPNNIQAQQHSNQSNMNQQQLLQQQSIESISSKVKFNHSQKIHKDIIDELLREITQQLTETIKDQQNLTRFIAILNQNTEKYIVPQTVIDSLGGYVRLRQLALSSLPMLNSYINVASKLNHFDEGDVDLIDKYIMPAVCAVLNEDIETLRKQISAYKSRQRAMSSYDFFTIKKLVWDIMGAIKLTYAQKYQVILSIENLRYEVFENPFSGRYKELGQMLAKNYEICCYFRSATAVENEAFIAGLMHVLYWNGSYDRFNSSFSSRLMFNLNRKFFYFLEKFLLEETREKDSKSIMDLSIRCVKLRIKAGFQFNFFSLIQSQDADTFFNVLSTYLETWMQKYNLSNSIMDSNVFDFKFLEIFIKWVCNLDDLFSIMDTEPAFMHFVVNDFQLELWIKGITAFMEEHKFLPDHFTQLIDFIQYYLLIKTTMKQPSLKQILKE